MARYSLNISVFGLVFAVALFASAGRLDWPVAWCYWGLWVAAQIPVIFLADPALLGDRASDREGKSWDRALAPLGAFLGPISIWIVSGLDDRFAWSPPVPIALQLGGLAATAGGTALSVWAIVSNRFFYATVCVRKEQRHHVVTDGAYRVVRHPGYLGALLFNMATPLALDSLWALVPAVATTMLVAVRTTLEDRTLRDELEGYAGYARQTRYRLIPRVW